MMLIDDKHDEINKDKTKNNGNIKMNIKLE